MLWLLNKDRRRDGLEPVRMQEDLRTVARKHSLDMAQKDYFDHVNLKAQSPFDRLKISGITDVVAGENLAKIGGFPNPTQHAEVGLMNSPGHRANILNGNYNVVGIGIIHDSSGIYYFTQNFAKRVLVLKGALPRTIRLKKGLRLHGIVYSDVKALVCQVCIPHRDEIFFQKVFPVQGRDFDFILPFTEPGTFSVSLFVDTTGGGHFVLSNRFELRVKRGWLF